MIWRSPWGYHGNAIRFTFGDVALEELRRTCFYEETAMLFTAINFKEMVVVVDDMMCLTFNKQLSNLDKPTSVGLMSVSFKPALTWIIFCQ